MFKQLPIKEQARFAHRMHLLLKAGISITEALPMIARTKRGRAKKIYDELDTLVAAGTPCGEACKKVAHGKAFDTSFISMIAVGESSGSLEEAFRQSATLLEKREALKKKLVGVMIYPSFIACSTLGIALFLVIYIFPKIIPLIVSMNIPLPLLTQVIMAMSDAFIHHWLLIVAGCVGAVAVWIVSWKVFSWFRALCQKIALRLPIIGTLLRYRVVVSIFRTLSLMLGAGEVLPKSLLIAGTSVSWPEYQHRLEYIHKKVVEGVPIARLVSVESHPSHRVLFPQPITDLIDIGDRTGSLVETCEHIATFFEGEVDDAIKNISQLIEPILMLGMGLVVGSIALSIVMPIYEITNHLSK